MPRPLSPRDAAHWVRIYGALKIDPELSVTELESSLKIARQTIIRIARLRGRTLNKGYGKTPRAPNSVG